LKQNLKYQKTLQVGKHYLKLNKTHLKKALAGLTGLDTHQADDGMPLVMLHTTDLRKKAVYSFMAMMEKFMRKVIRIFLQHYYHLAKQIIY